MPRDKKLPALQFYPGDWRKDIAVQSLSFHDRGVWFEMLMLMHDSEQRGMLILNGRPMSEEMVARAIGLDIQTFNQTLTTLLTNGVAERDPNTNAVMNRRMVRDEKVRKIHAEAGKKGGNPVLVNQKSNQTVNQKPTPSSSSSTSEHISDANASSPRRDADGEPKPEPDELIYGEYPRKEGHRAALVAIEKAVDRIRKGEGVIPPMEPREARVYLYRRVQTYARSPAGSRADKTMIPHPATWFGQSRYLDDESNWQLTGEKTNGGSGANQPSATRQRVDRNLSAIAKALERRGIEMPGGAGGPDGAEVPGAGLRAIAGGVSSGLRAVGAEVLPPQGAGRAGGTAH